MNVRLGIIGAGQLGLYLCQAARKLGVSTCLLSETATAPAATFTDRLVVGELEDPVALEQFLEGSDVVTFDKEDIPEESLDCLLQAEADGRIRVHPGAEILRLLKDKGTQKSWLEEQGFPTLPFKLLTGDDIDHTALVERFGLPLVQKARRGGYDGRGVQILRDDAALDDLWPTPSLIEPFLGGSLEIAVLLARDVEGNCEAYPTLGMEFDPVLNSVTTVFTPSSIDPALAESAIDLGKRVISALGGVGVFALEMWVTEANELFINEISPRVHNSGHLTMEAASASQFEQHVRACVGLPLMDVSDTKPSAMVNILYESNLEQSCPGQPTCQLDDDEQVAVHWYGKPPGQLGRKMGHVTAWAAQAGDATTRAQETRNDLPNRPATEAA